MLPVLNVRSVFIVFPLHKSQMINGIYFEIIIVIIFFLQEHSDTLKSPTTLRDIPKLVFSRKLGNEQISQCASQQSVERADRLIPLGMQMYEFIKSSI